MLSLAGVILFTMFVMALVEAMGFVFGQPGRMPTLLANAAPLLLAALIILVIGAALVILTEKQFKKKRKSLK